MKWTHRTQHLLLHPNVIVTVTWTHHAFVHRFSLFDCMTTVSCVLSYLVGGLPVAMERLRRFSRLLSRHWSAQTVMPGYVSHCSDSATGHAHFAPPLPLSASALAPVNVGDAQSVSAAHLPGTVRLSVLNGTSGIFIAKIRKRMLPVKS